MDACMWMFLQMGLRAFGYLCVQVCMCMCAHVYVCAYVCVCALCMFVPNSIVIITPVSLSLPSMQW